MGNIHFQSGQSVFDNNGVIAPGAKLYFFEANTTTPLTTYSDADLTSERTHPVLADGYGRIPAIYLPFGSYDVQAKTSGGTQLFYYTEIANPEPFDDTTTFDTATVLTTGDIFFSLKNGTRTGAVRLNGRTIGNTNSLATERADPDTSDLFSFLWSNLANGQAAVSGGRGASSAEDFAANKTITLPDFRGCGPVGFDDMGNTAASLLGSAPVVSGSTILAGSILGANTHTISTANLPVTTPAGSISTPSISGSAAAQTFTGTGATLTATGNVGISDTRTWATSNSIYPTGGVQGFAAGAVIAVAAAAQAVTATGGSISGSFTGTGFSYTPAGTNASSTLTATSSTPTFTGTSFGSGTAHNILARSGLCTWHIKL